MEPVIRSRTYPYKQLPAGVVQKDGRVKLAVTFTPELFNKLKARAEARKETFSETVNDCAGCGLFDLEEAGE